MVGAQGGQRCNWADKGGWSDGYIQTIHACHAVAKRQFASRNKGIRPAMLWCYISLQILLIQHVVHHMKEDGSTVVKDPLIGWIQHVHSVGSGAQTKPTLPAAESMLHEL